MSTPVRLLGFLAAAAAVFGLAVVVGRAVGPVDTEVAAHDESHDDGSGDAGTGNDGTGNDDAAPADAMPAGLTVSQDGYTLDLADQRPAAGADRVVRFTITGPDGTPVTAYDVAHEKQLHLIAVRRDVSGFQHVHPTLGDDGVWTARLDLTPGTWRLFADFTATGAAPLTLGADLSVAGDLEPVVPAGERRTADAGDGYAVALDGDLRAGRDARLTLRVSKDGEPVTDLQPYLGAYGHLVALRGGDLAYLHVHPDGEPGDGTTAPGPDVVFHTAVPSAGTYHLYLDFRHDGVVRTAAFTVTVTGTAADAGAGETHTEEHADTEGEGSEHGH